MKKWWCSDESDVAVYVGYDWGLVLLCMLQLQHLVCDDICIQVRELYHHEKRHHATGGYMATCHQRQQQEAAYQRKAEQVMTDENCFKILFVSMGCFRGKNKPATNDGFR